MISDFADEDVFTASKDSCCVDSDVFKEWQLCGNIFEPETFCDLGAEGSSPAAVQPLSLHCLYYDTVQRAENQLPCVC